MNLWKWRNAIEWRPQIWPQRQKLISRYQQEGVWDTTHSSGSFCKHAASTLLSHLVYTLTQMIYFNTKFIYPIGVFHIWCTEEKYQPYNEWAHLPVVFPELSHFAADWSSPFANMFKSQKSLTISLAELFNYISSKWRDTISFLSHKVSQSLCVHLLAK